jgi:hypothetical protein
LESACVATCEKSDAKGRGSSNNCDSMSLLERRSALIMSVNCRRISSGSLIE